MCIIEHQSRCVHFNMLLRTTVDENNQRRDQHKEGKSVTHGKTSDSLNLNALKPI